MLSIVTPLKAHGFTISTKKLLGYTSIGRTHSAVYECSTDRGVRFFEVGRDGYIGLPYEGPAPSIIENVPEAFPANPWPAIP